jgi:hypothetical protein
VSNLLSSDNPGLGIVYLRSARASIPPGLLRGDPSELVPADPRVDGAALAFAIAHPTLGRARVWIPAAPPDVEQFLEFGLGLTQGEAAVARQAHSAVMVEVPAEINHVLGDRKRLLRFLRVFMGEDAVLAVDLASGMPWSRAALDHELCHDADLDAEALYVYHAIQSDRGRADWIHTHGLAELGGFDLDIVRPNEVAQNWANDIFRALVFQQIEGRISESTDEVMLAFPGGKVSLVPAAEFMTTARPIDRAPREMGPRAFEPHLAKRSVICNPFSPNMKSRQPEASSLLSSLADDNLMVAFTNASTELMAERARRTIPLFGSLVEQLAELPVQPLVKLGFRTSAGGREHLWFEVHSTGEFTVDCTLVNEPYDVPELRVGVRAQQQLAHLSDWIIMTPLGQVSPRSTLAARRLGEIPDAARRELIELKRRGSPRRN